MTSGTTLPPIDSGRRMQHSNPSGVGVSPRPVGAHNTAISDGDLARRPLTTGESGGVMSDGLGGDIRVPPPAEFTFGSLVASERNPYNPVSDPHLAPYWARQQLLLELEDAKRALDRKLRRQMKRERDAQRRRFEEHRELEWKALTSKSHDNAEERTPSPPRGSKRASPRGGGSRPSTSDQEGLGSSPEHPTAAAGVAKQTPQTPRTNAAERSSPPRPIARPKGERTGGAKGTTNDDHQRAPSDRSSVNSRGDGCGPEKASPTKPRKPLTSVRPAPPVPTKAKQDVPAAFARSKMSTPRQRPAKGAQPTPADGGDSGPSLATAPSSNGASDPVVAPATEPRPPSTVPESVDDANTREGDGSDGCSTGATREDATAPSDPSAVDAPPSGDAEAAPREPLSAAPATGTTTISSLEAGGDADNSNGVVVAALAEAEVEVDDGLVAEVQQRASDAIPPVQPLATNDVPPSDNGGAADVEPHTEVAAATASTCGELHEAPTTTTNQDPPADEGGASQEHHALPPEDEDRPEEQRATPTDDADARQEHVTPPRNVDHAPEEVDHAPEEVDQAPKEVDHAPLVEEAVETDAEAAPPPESVAPNQVASTDAAVSPTDDSSGAVTHTQPVTAADDGVDEADATPPHPHVVDADDASGEGVEGIEQQ